MVSLEKEVLEEFADASHLGIRSYNGFGVAGWSDDLPIVRGYQNEKLGDAADKFICADEVTREQMRQEPRVIPKSVEPTIIRRPLLPAGSRVVTIGDARAIRSLLLQGTGVREVGRRWGIPHATVQRIRDYKTFRDDRTRESPHERRIAKARRSKQEYDVPVPM